MDDRFHVPSEEIRRRRDAGGCSTAQAIRALRTEALTVAIETIRQEPTLDRDLLADVLSALLADSRS